MYCIEKDCPLLCYSVIRRFSRLAFKAESANGKLPRSSLWSKLTIEDFCGQSAKTQARFDRFAEPKLLSRTVWFLTELSRFGFVLAFSYLGWSLRGRFLQRACLFCSLTRLGGDAHCSASGWRHPGFVVFHPASHQGTGLRFLFAAQTCSCQNAGELLSSSGNTKAGKFLFLRSSKFRSIFQREDSQTWPGGLRVSFHHFFETWSC